ncbi:hypothetical protein pEaSNUABM29_00273 [Erwinia phage pEa_SNUABM_29]|nr:hypothetical protein pEaSNUABM29_00273 [Erwinia phage pEa_SNUABM_29]
MHLVDRFLRKKKLFNVHAIVSGEDFTDEIHSLLIKYGLNVIIPVNCVEKGHESVAEIEKRNPGFEARVLAYPRHKIELLRRSDMEGSPESIIALGMSFPRLRIRNLRNTTPVDSYYAERQIFEEHLLPQLEQEEQHDISVLWGDDLDQSFQMLDFGLLFELGLIEEDECLLLAKA